MTAPPIPGGVFDPIDFGRQGHVVAAVSGGGDSLSLLVLLKTHLSRLAGAPALTAVTVDHGLRPESAAEARLVAAFCTRHDIPHRTVRWNGPRPATGLAAAARAARFDLLAGTARTLGAGLVLTGHTRDDQAETVAMRATRGGGRGAAGIAPATLHNGSVWFARPLLAVRRQALRDYLAGRGLSWIDDPSNDNPAFERVRTRRALDTQAVERLARQADRAAAERTALGRRAARLIGAHAGPLAPGLYRLAADLFAQSDQEAALYAFRILAAMAGGATHLAGSAAAGRAFAALRAGRSATLSRAVMDVRRAGIHLHRERRNLPAAWPAGKAGLWDGRYWLEAAAPERIAPFGGAGALLPAPATSPVPLDLLLAAQSSEPALWRFDRPLRPARCAAGAAIGVPAPWAQLLPSFDLAAANAVSALLGGETIMPCHHPNTITAEA